MDRLGGRCGPRRREERPNAAPPCFEDRRQPRKASLNMGGPNGRHNDSWSPEVFRGRRSDLIRQTAGGLLAGESGPATT